MDGIFVLVNLKNQLLCLYKRQMAVGVGANPGKFTRQKPKRKPKAAPHTRPDTAKSPQQTKRNREFRRSTNFPYLCCVFLPSYRPQRYFDRPAGIRPGGVFVSINVCVGLMPAFWRPFPADSCTNNRIGTIPRKNPFPIDIWPSFPGPIQSTTRTFLS